jgi:hypothetical protein
VFNCEDCLDSFGEICGKRTKHDFIPLGNVSWWGPVIGKTPWWYSAKRKLIETHEWEDNYGSMTYEYR